MPKISIITIAYNNLEGLKNTVNSVISQTETPYEFIVIDGGSSDGSKEFLQENASHFAYWISEPDKGIYNAMNKGIAKATGDYLLFLNSGDVFSAPDMLQKIKPYFGGEDLVYGDAYYETKEQKYEYRIPRKITLGTLLKEPICHQSAFFKKSLFEEFGGYDETLKIASDHTFNLNLFIKKSPSQRHVPEYISVFDKNGISCTNPELGFNEIKSFLDKNLSPDLQKMALQYDELKKFHDSKWGQTARKIREKYLKTRYRK